MTDFRIGVDWRRKGFICWDARPGDPLNVLPTPITYASIAYNTYNGSTVKRQKVTSVFGRTWYDIQTGTSPNAGVRLGTADDGTVDTIPVAPNTTYTLRLYGRSPFMAVPFNLVVRDQAGTLLGNQSNITWSDVFTPRTVTFTTGSASTHLTCNVLKANNTANVPFQLVGFMLVEGNTMPAAYNMGREVDLYDNITDRVISANWFLGMRRIYQEIADDSMLKLTLDNHDRRFSPEHTPSPLYGSYTTTLNSTQQTVYTNYRVPFRPIEVQSIGPALSGTGGNVRRTHYRGWIESFKPSVNVHGDRRAEVTCAGPMLFFKRLEADIALQTYQRTDAIVSKLLAEVEMPSAIAEAPLLGDPQTRVNHVELPDVRLKQSLDEGQTTLQYAADNWVSDPFSKTPEERRFNIYQAIQDTAAAERGRFFFDRQGKAVFWNRHVLIKKAIPEAPTPGTGESTSLVGTPFDSRVTDMDYEYAGLSEFINDIRVTCHPRTLSANNNVLLYELVYDYQNPKPGIVVPPGQEKVVNISFRDESSNRVGALNVQVTNLRWAGGVAVDYTDQFGNAQTEFLDVPPGTYSLETTANGAKMRIRAGDTYAHLLQFEVRGQAIYDRGPIEAVAEDQMSITRYGRRTQQLNIAALDNPNLAQDIADFEVYQRSSPTGKLRQITLISQTAEEEGRHSEQLAYTIGESIDVIEGQTRHDRKYVIIGEAQRLNDGGTRLETTWYLEPLVEEKWARAEDVDFDNPQNDPDNGQAVKPPPGATALDYGYRLAY